MRFSDPNWLRDRPIAHRGLHNIATGTPENSLAAFRAAIDGGYAIECDIRLSSDGVPYVFHDDTLERMTGYGGRFGETHSTALDDLRLQGGREAIPRFGDLLDLVVGRVPLVVELKGTDEAADRGFVETIAPQLASYEGPLALMSFAGWLVADLAPLRNRHPVGLTAEGLRQDQLSRHRDIFEAHCNFVSYNVHHLPNPFVDWVRNERELPVISWTVRMPDDVAQSGRYADQMTFEGFLPGPGVAAGKRNANGSTGSGR